MVVGAKKLCVQEGQGFVTVQYS